MLPTQFDSLKNNYFNHIFSQSNNPAILLTSTGEVLGCNNALLQLYKLSLNQIINKNYFIVFKENDITPAFSSLNDMLSNSSASIQTITNHNAPSTRAIQWTASLIEHDNQTKNICIYGVDISTFVNESIKTKKIQGSIIDHLPNHFIFWKDTEGVYMGCNAAFAHSLGFKSPQEIIGKTDYDLPVKKEDSDAYRADDKEVIASKKPKLDIEEPQTLASGETRILLTSKVPLIDENNQVYGVLAIYSDITEMKKMSISLQEALHVAKAASAAKTEFIRNMSHDLRTPLSGIIGMSDMIQRMPETVSVQEGTKDIHSAAISLLNLLNEIIETSQLESGNTTHKKICFSLKTTINALTAIFKPAIKQKGLTLEIFYDDNIPDVLFGQELLLHRIILNLLGNAVKFTAHGTISLEVSLSQKNLDKAILQIVVKDTGGGIPAEKLNLIFEKFSRLTPSYKNDYSGSGLGLYIVKEFIQKLGGDIKVNSTFGKGTQFTCNVQFKIPTKIQLKKYYPTPPMQHKEIQKQQDIIIPKLDTKKKTRVLLVEDTLLPRKIAENLLTKENFAVITAETAKEAIEKTFQYTFDLIYMDIGLPDGTGIEVTKTIRTDLKNPNINTFIIALTAHSDPEVARECLAAGMQQVFDKPLTVDKIKTSMLSLNRFLCPTGKTYKKNETLIVNLKSTAAAIGGNEAMAKEMLSMFMSELPLFRNKIVEAFTMKDLPALKQHIHKLHGALCYIDISKLKTVVNALEKQLINQEKNYNENYQILLDEIDLLIIEYKKLINQ